MIKIFNNIKIKKKLKSLILSLFCYKFLRINIFYNLPRFKHFKRYKIRFQHLNSKSTVIDLGANVGEFSSYISDMYNSKVYLYEPNPNCFSILKKLFNKNKKVKIFKLGVTNSSGFRKLYFHQNDINKDSFFAGCSYDKNKYNIFIKNFLYTKTINIQNILLRHKTIDLLKIDIEGEEYRIIKPILKNINKIKCILIELHFKSNEYKERKNKLIKIFKDKKLLNKKIFLWI
jgi:FkbM family methyltransferase